LVDDPINANMLVIVANICFKG